MEESTNSNDNKKFIIIIAVALVIIFGIIVYFVIPKDASNNGDNNGGNNSNSSINPAPMDLSAKMIYNKYDLNGRILHEVKNNNEFLVDAIIKTDFYDENGKVVNTQENRIANIPSGKVSYYLTYPNINIEYNTYSSKVEYQAGVNYADFSSQINIVNKNIVDNYYNFEVKNDSSEIVNNIMIVALFYKDNVIVNYGDTILSRIVPGQTVSSKIYIDNYNAEKIEYDREELIVISAFKGE